MSLWNRVALAALLAFGVAAPLYPRAALAQEKGEKGGEEMDSEEEQLSDLGDKAMQQLEAKDWDGALKTYDALEKAVAKSKLTADQKRAVMQNAHYNIACAWSLKGEKEKALAAFEKSLDEGFDDWDHIVADTDLDNIRKEPKFIALIKQYKEKASAGQAAEIEKQKAEFVAQISKDAVCPLDFDLTAFDGKPLKLADLKGKVVLVDVWGTWCPPCRKEIPHLVELNEKLGPQGFTVVGLNWERTGPTESKTEVPKFMKENKIEYPCALINDDFTDKYGIEAFPTMFLIDRDGKVRLKKRGYTEGALLEAAAMKLLAEAGGAAPKDADKPASGDGKKKEDF
jgi:thiol-disulfide isomerase/thioredoxin